MQLKEICEARYSGLTHLGQPRKDLAHQVARYHTLCPKCGSRMNKGTNTQTGKKVTVCPRCLTTTEQAKPIIKKGLLGLLEAYEFAKLKKRKVPLEDEERAEAIKAGAVWHPSNHDKPTCAIWKSKKSNGGVVYGSNTHRVFQVHPTLKGAIKLFHDVVKGTS